MTLINQISFPASAVDLPPGSVVVAANCYAGLFSGPLSQLLKCLTAIKVCAEFKNKGIAAVPVCLVRQDAPPGFSPLEISFIDRNSTLHCLKSAEREDGNYNCEAQRSAGILPASLPAGSQTCTQR